MDESTGYKDENSREPGAVSPGAAWAASLAENDGVGPATPIKTAWDDLSELFEFDRTMNLEPSGTSIPDHSVVLLALQERMRAVADGIRHQKLFDARDASYHVEFLGKLLRLVVARKLNDHINPAPRRAGVFVTDSEVG